MASVRIRNVAKSRDTCPEQHHDLALTRIKECQKVAEDNVVLDFGLWARDERSALRWIAASVGAFCEIVYLPVDRELQLSRVRECCS